MALLRFITLCFLFNSAFSYIKIEDKCKSTATDVINEEASIFIPLFIPTCYDDMDGVQASMDLFLQRTAFGLPTYNIWAMDPYIIPKLVIRACGVELHFTNFRVNGMKNRLYKTYYFDKKKMQYNAQTIDKPYIYADLAVHMNCGNVYTGKYSSHSTALATVTLCFSVKQNKNGEDYFVLGPETVDVTLEDKPRTKLSRELREALKSDKKGRKVLACLESGDFPEQLIIAVVRAVHVRITHNVREAAKRIPCRGMYID